MTGDPLSALLVQIDDTLDEPQVVRPRSRRRKPRPRCEADIRADAMAEIQALGGYVVVAHQDGSGERGTPDLISCVPVQGFGRAVVIEVKREDAEPPTPVQLKRLRDWQAAGALAGWIRNIAHLRELLDHLKDARWVNDFSTPGDGRVRDAQW